MRRKHVLEEEKNVDFFPKGQPQLEVIEENEEEEGYLTVGEDGREDGRPYIPLRRKQETRKDKKEATEYLGAQIKNRGEDSCVGEDGREEEVQITDYRDAEIEGLIREYKKKAQPTQSAIKIL